MGVCVCVYETQGFSLYSMNFIYIYIYRERERERERMPKRVRKYLPKFHQTDFHDNSNKRRLAQTTFYYKSGHQKE